MNSLKIIKAVVFFLTFLMIAGLITLSLIISKKVKKTPVQIATEISLEQPQGTEIQQISSNDKFLYVLIKNQASKDKIIIINTESGKTVSTISIN
ncbi:MAG: DUF6476 family protein [Alphaproteobacteria bacterium]